MVKAMVIRNGNVQRKRESERKGRRKEGGWWTGRGWEGRVEEVSNGGERVEVGKEGMEGIEGRYERGLGRRRGKGSEGREGEDEKERKERKGG